MTVHHLSLPHQLVMNINNNNNNNLLSGDSSLPDTEPDINDLMNFVAVHVEGDKWKMVMLPNMVVTSSYYTDCY